MSQFACTFVAFFFIIFHSSKQEQLEKRLEKLEYEWAEFCESASNLKSSLEDNLMIWKEFEKDCDKMKAFLNEQEQNITRTIGKGIDIQAIGIEQEKIKVCSSMGSTSSIMFLSDIIDTKCVN